MIFGLFYWAIVFLIIYLICRALKLSRKRPATNKLLSNSEPDQSDEMEQDSEQPQSSGSNFDERLARLNDNVKKLFVSSKSRGYQESLATLVQEFDDLTKMKKELYDCLTVESVIEYNKLAISIMSLKNIGDVSSVKKVLDTASPLTKSELNKIKQTTTRLAEQDFDTRLVNTDVDLRQLADRLSKSGITEFSLCLYGAPGTGKSAYAKYLAKRLGLDIIIKRASDLKSKMVGDTEKAIATAFEQAESANAMLVFDEADSFLRDRNLSFRSWEVSEVNEMLTQMENAKIPFVCTTNLLSTIDRAALRRFVFKVKYDFLTQDQVALAFKRFFGKNLTVSVKHLTKLSPGDFSVVQKKARILKITDETELVKMLEQEMATKQE